MFDFSVLEKCMSKQCGLITRAQILALGVKPARLVRAMVSGRLVTVHRGVYRRPETPVTDELKRRAALLWAGPDAVLSHLTAARVWKLDGLPRDEDEPIWLSAPPRMCPRPTQGVRVVRAIDLKKGRDFGLVQGLACTSLKRTVADVARVLEPLETEMAYDSALRRDPQFHLELREYLETIGTEGRAGARVLLEIIERETLAAGSPLEVRVRQLLRVEGFVAPMPQLQICDPKTGEQLGIFDFAWPERRVVLLVDSWAHHAQRDAFNVDRVHAGDLVAIGWKPIPVTAHDLDTNPQGLASRIRRSLAKE